MDPAKKFIPEQVKQAALDEYLAGGQSLQEVATKYGMSDSLLHRLVTNLKKTVKQPVPEHNQQLQEELELTARVAHLLSTAKPEARQRVADHAVRFLNGQ